MDDERFDRLAQALAAGPSRRRFLHLISGGGLLAALGGARADGARAKKRGAKKQCERGKKKCGRRCIAKTECCTSGDCPDGETCRNRRCSNCIAADDCPAPAACTLAVCANGRCATSLLPPQTPCVSGQFCLVGETCNAAGECQGGTPRTCGDGIDCDFDPNHCGACGNRCRNQAPVSCGDTGVCDGGSCQQWGPGTTCDLAICTAESTLRLKRTCDGIGACSPRQTQDCAPYKCNFQMRSCLTACGGDEDCIASHFCAEEVCTPRL